MRALLLALATALAACSQTVELGGGSGTATLNGEWVMATRALRAPTITFADDGASGFAGCNRWFGQYTRNGDRLTFSAIGATRMACDEPAMSIERNFLGALEATRAARVEGNTLILLDAEGAEQGRFLRAP